MLCNPSIRLSRIPFEVSIDGDNTRFWQPMLTGVESRTSDIVVAMKTRISILLLCLAIMVGVIYFWPGRVSKAEYQPAPVFTTEDQLFVQQAYSTLQAAIAMDGNAEVRSHSGKVRDLAQRDKLEQKQMLLRLKQTVDAIDPDFRLERG